MRIGIIGSGKIVQWCLETLHMTQENHCEAICVREQSRDKAMAYQQEFGINTLYTQYDDLLADQDLDIIYLGIPNHLHFSYAEKALSAGKNVICEKPFTSKYEETERLAMLAKDRRLFLFEAITTIYAANVLLLKEKLDQIGDIQFVQSNFSQFSSRYRDYVSGKVHPVFDPKMAGGALYDINIYNIHLSCFLFGAPDTIDYRCNKGFNGIDTSGVVILQYPEFISVCIGAKDSNGINQTTIQGTDGYLRLTGSANNATSVELVKGDEVQRWDKRQFPDHFMIDEMKAFHDIFSRKDFDACYTNLDHSLLVMKIADKARAQAAIPWD